MIKRFLLFIFLSVSSLTLFSTPIQAKPSVGIHILETREIDDIDKVFSQEKEIFITIPIRTDQLDHKQWQEFFTKADEKNLIPLIRLATVYNPESDAWQIPTRSEIVKFAHFFSAMPWQGPRYIIFFNEPNHAKEWGGMIDPADYADVLSFATQWFETEPFDYVLLPAGLDAAAPNGASTMDSFDFIDAMVEAEPMILDQIDVWNSHAYPNPGFSSSAYRSAKNAIDGWEYELAYLKNNYNKEFQVIITETGWDQRNFSQWQLTQYYEHALTSVWNDNRIRGITPFILQGNNGVFNHFSFLLPDGSPSPQMKALLAAKQAVADKF